MSKILYNSKTKRGGTGRVYVGASVGSTGGVAVGAATGVRVVPWLKRWAH